MRVGGSDWSFDEVCVLKRACNTSRSLEGVARRASTEALVWGLA